MKTQWENREAEKKLLHLAFFLKSMQCYVCKQSCKAHVDLHCASCKINVHYVCASSIWLDPLNCHGACKMPFSDTTVGYWATNTREKDMDRLNCMYDLNYVYKGVILAVLPFKYLGGVVYKPQEPFIALDLTSGLKKFAEEHWHHIEEKLKSVKL